MRLALLVLEDEPGVREALLRDLERFAPTVRIDAAEDVTDAMAVLDELRRDGDRLAVVLADHRLPGRTGVDFLVDLRADPDHGSARTVLVTGQADQDDTIHAINAADLDHYLAKPWEPAELTQVVRDQLTDFVLATRVDPLPHLQALDAPRVLPLLEGRGDA
jgi:two-component system, OmpR family, phosphate regulon response regulator PhoB